MLHLIRNINDPEHPLSLEELNVVEQVRVKVGSSSRNKWPVPSLPSPLTKLECLVCRSMMARAPWTLNSHPPSPTAAWPRSSACPSKSSCSAVYRAGSRYENTTYFSTYIPSLSFLFSVCSQIDVHITPGTHASEEAGR